MEGFDEISLMQEQVSEKSENTGKRINFCEEQIELAEQTICDLRDLLTFMKGYKQIIDVNHPEARQFEHWEELNADLDAMALRLIAYEKQLHTTKKNEVA